MECNLCLSKYILCFFNFIVFIIGGAILGSGIWLYVEKDSFLDFFAANEQNYPQLKEMLVPDIVLQASYVLMAIGGIIFFLSLLGYCGAVVESRCLLVFYAILLLLLLILEITAGVLCYTYKDRVEVEVKSKWKDTIQNYDPVRAENGNAQTKIWNVMMVKLSCCGVDNYTDFSLSTTFVESHLKVPYSCCKLNGTESLLDPDCPRNPKPENSYYLTGCFKTVLDRVMDYMNIIMYVTIGVAVIEILATFFAFCLCASLRPIIDDYSK